MCTACIGIAVLLDRVNIPLYICFDRPQISTVNFLHLKCLPSQQNAAIHHWFAVTNNQERQNTAVMESPYKTRDAHVY